jgi:hypothetical protein
MKFWTETILKFQSALDYTLLSLEDLKRNFRRNIEPECLETVLVCKFYKMTQLMIIVKLEMEKKQQIKSIDTFKSELTSNWSGWIFNTLIKKPLFMLGSSLISSEPKLGGKKFVVVKMLNEKAKSLLSKHKGIIFF